jgi:hypothetical protein
MFIEEKNGGIDITTGLRTDVLKMLDNAIRNNSIESFYVIDGFIDKVLKLSISNKYQLHFKEYIEVPIFYYTLSYNKVGNSSGQNKMYDACTERAPMRLRETFWLMNFQYRKSDLPEKKIIIEFKMHAFSAFSQLLYEQVKRKDFNAFKTTLNLLKQAGTSGNYFNKYDLLSRLNEPQLNEDELEQYKINLRSYHYFVHTLLGIKYWLYFLYENNQFAKEEVDAYIKPINQVIEDNNMKLDFWEIELLFNYMNTSALDWYLKWQSWDYIEHEDGEPYYMQSPMEWVFKGVMIDAIQNQSFSNSLPVDCNQIEKQNPQNKSLLMHSLREKFKAIQQSEKWKEFLANIETNEIEQQFNQIYTFFEIENAKEIVSTELIHDKVSRFKEDFYNGWKNRKSLSIRKLFVHFNKIIPCEDRSKELFIVGSKLFIEKGKRFFLNETDYDFGVDSIANERGTDLSFAEDRFFFETVFKKKQEIVYGDFLLGLDTSITSLKKMGKVPNAIFLNHWDIYVHFERENNPKWNPDNKTDLSVGTYDNIAVFEYTYQNILQNRFIVADFEKAFSMLYREIPDAFDNVLKIDVKTISDELANEKLQKEPDKWKNIDGQQLSDEEALIYIRTSILLDYEVIELFEIDDTDAFEIGLIEK